MIATFEAQPIATREHVRCGCMVGDTLRASRQILLRILQVVGIAQAILLYHLSLEPL